MRSLASILCTAALASSGCGSNEPENNVAPVAPPITPPAPVPRNLLIEVDRMASTSEILSELTLTDGSQVSLATIYRPANLNLTVVHDKTDIPRTETVRLAELHALMRQNSSVQPTPNQWKVYELIVTQDEEDPNTLGIMFDFGANDSNGLPRESFAVFQTAHESLPNGRAMEVLLTSAHELAHALNLHHADWDGTSFQSGATVESYSMADTVRWKLSANSIEHLRNAPEDFVRPGAGGVAFGLVTAAHAQGHKSTPNEFFEIVDPNVRFASRNAPATATTTAIRGTLSRSVPAPAGAPSPLSLTLTTAKSTYVVGEPITVTVALTNTGDTAQRVLPLLSPEYQFLSILIGDASQQPTRFATYRPPVLREARKVAARTLQKNESIITDAKIFFGADGWTFEKAGKYEIMAMYPADPAAGALAQTTPLSISVIEPPSESDTASSAKRLLMEPKGQRLGTGQGLFLYMEGGAHLGEAAQKVRQIVETLPNAPQAAGARLALAREAIAPTTDPQKGKAAPNLPEAERYLQQLKGSDAVSGATLLRVQGELVKELEDAGQQTKARAVTNDAIASATQRKDLAGVNRRAVAEHLESGK